MKTAGLVLDFYDDKTGSILKTACPTPDSLPGAVKTAHVLSSEERDLLRDDAFALILHNDGKMLRKFACVDEGNTVLSTLYFMETFDRLPVEAIKTAAARLSYFNEEFGLPVPSMLKLAAETGMARKRDSFKQPVVGDEADWAQRTNLVSVRGGADSGRVNQSINNMKTAGLIGMTYDPNNANIKSLQAQHGTNWKSVLGQQRGISPESIVEKTGSVEKTAIIGPLGDITGLGVPSTVGYHYGRQIGQREAEKGYDDDSTTSKAFGGLLVPGYIGYHYGKKKGRAEGKKKHKEKHSSAAEKVEREERKRISRGAGRIGGTIGALGGAAAGAALLRAGRVGGAANIAKVVGGGALASGAMGYAGAYGATRLGNKINSVAGGRRSIFHRKKKHSSAIAIDVSHLEPEAYTVNKTASITALNGRYSLDSYSDVKDAVRFFEENWPSLDPAERHEFSVKTASRADDLGIALPELMERYGSTSYSPDVEAHLANRRAVAPQFSTVWNDLQEKRAMIEPEQFASLLREADELCDLNYSWGGAVADPYLATFGGRGHEKLAWAWQNADGDSLDEASLRAIPSDKLSANFTPDFAEAFSHDPVTIFESMPDTSKTIIARMAGG